VDGLGAAEGPGETAGFDDVHWGWTKEGAWRPGRGRRRSGAEPVPVLGQTGLDLFEIETKALGLDDEPLEIRPEQFGALARAARRGLGDDAADGGGRHEHALRDQRGHDLMGGVWIDAQFLAEHAHRGEPVARTKLPADDRLFHRVEDLLRHGLARLDLDRERQHAVLVDLGQVGRRAKTV
jgi:hypothetical protein